MASSPRRTALTAFIPVGQLLSSAAQGPRRSSSFSSSEEKYTILEQRDRLLREDRKRIVALDKAEALTGTCPDMCPEKERYLREIQSQLSPFEMLPGTDKVDHTAAIKEYSRSSGCLEKLLPHELRPLAVLSMTMDYIVTHIMDQGERNYQDWYSFVWNRTHGIRKDIIHQHLHDPQTVSLMEKCARFHIHCAHHLCEESVATFDAPINKDQITKCLFTLKEMYLDLASEGTSCRREAEFQAYAILLALNQGDVLRQVQQLQPHVCNSPEVKFAIQAFTALNSNNYVRFFKLVQAASYLNACLLHGYFSQARAKALRAVTATHTVSAQKTTGFPLDRVMTWLLFNDSREAVSFMHHYGLHVSEGYVELNRQALREPKQPFRPKRSTFILEKLTMSVGEVVNGEPLPAVPQHIPETSFSPRGEYIGERAEMIIASSWKSTHVDVTVSPSGRRTEKRFLGPQESESAASSSFLPFMDLELFIMKRRHVFPRLGQNEKIKENILHYEEWKRGNRRQREFGWKGENESRQEFDDGAWLEMQEWEGEYSERLKGQNGEIWKDQGKEDRGECDKQGGRIKYGSSFVQENRKREQGKEKDGRTWNTEHKYEKIWEMPDEATEGRIYLKRHIREMKGGRKRGQDYEEELEIADKRKIIAQNQGRKTGRHQERRENSQEHGQLNQEEEKENSCETRSQREQGRPYRGMQGGSGDNVWERKEAVTEEVEEWWWNYREMGKGKRKQKDIEEEKEKQERHDQKRKSSRDREHKYYKEKYGEKEVNWEKEQEGKKTRKEGNEKGHSHKKGGQNTQYITKKYGEKKKSENWEKEYREKQETKDGRGEGQCGVEKGGENRERKAGKVNFKDKKEERHITEEDRENDQDQHWNRKDRGEKGENECEHKKIKKLKRENYKHLNFAGKEKRRYLNEEIIKWERECLPTEGQEQYDQRGQDGAQRSKEEIVGKEHSKKLDEDKWRLERKNRKIRYERIHEQEKKETKSWKREVWGSNYGKEWGIEDGELVDDSLEIRYSEKWTSDPSEKLWERGYQKDQDNKIRRKWGELPRERDYNEQERKNGQELNEKAYRHKDPDEEKVKKKYSGREGKVIPDEWERKYRKEKKVEHNDRSNREKIEEQKWNKEPLKLKRIPLKYLDNWNITNQEELEDTGRGRGEGQRIKKEDRREDHEEEKYDEVKTLAVGKECEKSLQEVNRGTFQRTECKGNTTVDQGGNKQKQKQKKDKGRYREIGEIKHEKMWETEDQEGLDKEGIRCEKDQRRDHGCEPSEEDCENEHEAERNRDEGWGRDSRKDPRGEENQAQEIQNTWELKEKEHGRGISGILDGQWKATSEEIYGNDQELQSEEQDLRDQGKGKRKQNRQKWEAEYGEVKREIGIKHCEGRQEEQPKKEDQEITLGRGKARENEDCLEGDIRLKKEDREALSVDKGMNDTRNAEGCHWEREWGKGNERTCAKKESVGKSWEKLYRELEGEIWLSEVEESLKYLGGDQEERKEKEGDLEQKGTIEKKGESLLNIKYSKEEKIGKRGKETHREVEEDYQKNDDGEKMEISASPEKIIWGSEVQRQLGRQKSLDNSEEEQKYQEREDETARRLEQENSGRVEAQEWEGDCWQEGLGEGLEKWPEDTGERQKGKPPEAGETQEAEEKVFNGEAWEEEYSQEKLTLQSQELLIRSGKDQQEDVNLSEEEFAVWGSENKEESPSASHSCELASAIEEPLPAVVAGPENGLNNEGAQGEASQGWMRLSRSRKDNLPWELQDSVCMAAWAPLDLPSLVADCHLVPRQELFWKVLLILPGYDTCFAYSPTRVLMDWLRTKFMGAKVPPRNGANWSNDRVETLCTLKSQRQKWNLTVDINICIKALHGVCTKEQLQKAQTQGSLFALNGLIFLLPTRRRGVYQDSYWHLARLRLSQLLKAKPAQPLVPLVILVPADIETLGEEEAKAGLRLRDLITSHLISYFTILRIPCYIQDLEGSNQVQEAVRWLVCYSSPAAELCCETFTHFMEKGINCEFGERLSRDQKDRQLAGLPSQEPEIILELYNSVIEFLAGVVSAKQLCSPSGLAPEFFRLNNQKCLQPQGSMPEYLEWLRSITLSLQLPPVVLPQKTSWQCTCSSILKYVHHLFGSHPSYPLLHCQVEHLLSQAYCHWWTRDFGEQQEPSGMEVPWDVIICLCIQQLLQTWSPPRQPGTPEAGEQQGREIQVCYFKDSLREYCLPDSWENTRLKTRREMLQHEKEQAL
ncbi:trichohyalin-like isoform X1 [Sarcophilus harrisii]|uniref:Germinal-center associated nuclear protein n=1 Tax=Sarcophilus harrisii TaxID=9305 RepID=A0A7N4V5N1_SARHA|nr:trichohyalin-like isoform X1 [Sarcophilus harrisii]